MELLRIGGISHNTPNGIVTPSDFAKQLPNSNSVRATLHIINITSETQFSITGNDNFKLIHMQPSVSVEWKLGVRSR